MRSGERHLLYLYCIFDPTPEVSELLSQTRIPGVEQGEPLFAIETSGVAAAASRVPREQFCEDALNELLLDLPRLTPYAVRHEQAIREIFNSAQALIPLSFGSVYLSESGVRRMLIQHAPEFRNKLNDLREQQEWEIKVFQRPAVLLAAAAAAGGARSSTSDGEQPGPGKAYLLRRLQERWSVAEAGRMTAEMLRTIQSRLSEISAAARIENSEGATAETIDLVCRLALLVPTQKSERLLTVIDALRRDYDPLGLTMELNGPWPAYSFVGEGYAAG
jgi:hypothetical protein